MFQFECCAGGNLCAAHSDLYSVLILSHSISEREKSVKKNELPVNLCQLRSAWHFRSQEIMASRRNSSSIENKYHLRADNGDESLGDSRSFRVER